VRAFDQRLEEFGERGDLLFQGRSLVVVASWRFDASIGQYSAAMKPSTSVFIRA